MAILHNCIFAQSFRFPQKNILGIFSLLFCKFIPDFVCLINILGCISLEFGSGFVVIVEVKLTVDYFKHFWVHTGNLAGR